MITLPPLPLPKDRTRTATGFDNWYDEDQMRDYAIAAVNAYENGVRHDEIRRAIAIAQAVEEAATYHQSELNCMGQRLYVKPGLSLELGWVLHRADELLKEWK